MTVPFCWPSGFGVADAAGEHATMFGMQDHELYERTMGNVKAERLLNRRITEDQV
jgi:hypothetical protein